MRDAREKEIMRLKETEREGNEYESHSSVCMVFTGICSISIPVGNSTDRADIGNEH